jgi:hypothetical protein
MPIRDSHGQIVTQDQIDQAKPGQMHDIDRKFYELAIIERDFERARADALQALVDALIEERDDG